MSKSNENIYYDEGIAVIGIGCIYPKAKNREEFWNNIVNGVDCITEIPDGRFDVENHFSTDRSETDKSYSNI